MSTKRWLDEASDADGFERSLLESGLDAEPPPRAEDEVWQRVLTAVAPPLGPGPGGGAIGAATAAKGATVTTLGRGFLLGVAASVAVAGADRVMTHQRASASATFVDARPAPSSPARAPAAFDARSPLARVAAPSVVAPKVLDLASSELTGADARTVLANRAAPGRASGAPARASGAPARASGAPPALAASPALTASPPPVAAQGSVAAFPLPDAAPSLPKSRLEEEAALLQKARSELRSGALAAAFATLEASREKFSAPELYQEREALLIELLYRSGQRERARERATAFLGRFPESPHAAAVRAFVGSPK